MSQRHCKRIYTEDALEFWFERVGSDWERHFKPDELNDGRQLYRDGEIRALELSAGDAIIHGKLEKYEYYALVEWPNGQPEVRVSTEDRHLGFSLAAAGIYEIEELVADEISPLPKELVQAGGDDGKGADAAGNGNGNGNGSGNGQEAAAPEEAGPGAGAGDGAAAPPEPRARPLLVRFSPSEQGLAFEAYWHPPGGEPEPAFLNGRRISAHLNEAEREKLIRLTAMSHRAGFKWNARQRNYLLREPGDQIGFVRGRLETWRRYFEVEAGAPVAALGRGIQTLRVEALAEGVPGGAELRLTWAFHLPGGSLLTPRQAALVFKRPLGVVCLPGAGLVRVDESQAAAFADRLESARAYGGEELPGYLLFSLFGAGEGIPLRLAPGLERWRETLLRPPGEDGGGDRLPGFLRPYQQRGVLWLQHLCEQGCHPLLADEMGLGKTIQVAALLERRPIDGHPALVVCPSSVVPVWRREIAKFFPGLKVEVLRSGCTFDDAPGCSVWVASYSQLRRHKGLLEGRRFGYAVLDEAQQIKNPDAKVTAACLGIRADHRIALTGTPLENSPRDLWTLFRFLMPGLLGSRRYFEGCWEDGQFLDRLKRQVGPFVLRRTKRDVTRELPPKVGMELVCPLTEVQEREYRKIAERGLEEIGDDLGAAVRERTMGLFTLLTRLRQVSCDPGLLPWLDTDVNQSGKINLLLDHLEGALAGGHKVVVFSQFVSLLNRVRPAIEERFDVPIFALTGKTTDREKPVSGFQDASGAAVILVSLKAGGTGITLHAAEYVFLLDPWWNPAVEEQAIDRVHRIGQDKTVFVYRLVTHGTVEERVEQLKAGKREVFDRVLGGLGDVSEFGADYGSLGDLITLTAGAGNGG